jgi:tRNA 5-methylaminomethyl-2-thiouridine biosynthesis bifunctional protein
VTDSSDKLKTVLCHKGYMTPAMNKHLAMGSTYVKNDTNTEYRKAEANANLAMHQGAMQHANWVQDIVLNKGDYPGRAAIRCSLPDHLPTVGSVPDTSRQKEELADLYKAKNEQYYPIPSVVENIFLLTGLGSRGLTTVPLMAELLASQICREPLPLSNPLLNALKLGEVGGAEQ